MICRRILRQQKQWYSVRRLSSSPAAYPRNSPSAGVTSPVNNSRNTFMAAISYSRSKHTDLHIPYDMKRGFFSTQAVVDLPEGGIVDVPLAQTGEGIAECELLKWHVQEAEEVEEFQPLCEVQSDKATIEITSRYKGKVSELLHVPGDIVKVGETLLKIIVGEFPFPVQTGEDSASKKLEILEISDSDNQSSVVKNTNVNGVLSTPAVRNLAKQYGLDINDVSGSGKDGRVLREDVLKCAASKGIIKEALPNGSFAEQQHIPSSAAYNLDYEDKEVLLRGYQRAMVKSMTLAARIPHFHYVEEIKCDALVDLKSTFKAENSDPNIKHTFLPVLIKSLSMAMSKYPFLNSSFNEEMQKVILKGSHNIGIAMATQHGLVVPNIKKVQSLSILEITKELSRLQQLASANKLSPDDVSGGTITVSNIGAIGGKFGSPLVNSPEVAIIAIGKIQKIAQFADDGTVYPASIMNINIGADHRVLDGATVARFCNEWKLFIEKPELLMLHMR